MTLIVPALNREGTVYYKVNVFEVSSGKGLDLDPVLPIKEAYLDNLENQKVQKRKTSEGKTILEVSF